MFRRMLAHTTLHEPHLRRRPALALTLVAAVPRAQHAGRRTAGAGRRLRRRRSPFTDFMAAAPRARRGVGHHHRRRARAHRRDAASATSPSKAPVDADTVFRIASMTKSFTAIVDPQAARRRQAVARRSGGEVRAGDEGARLPDDRLAEDHHPPPAVARRRVSRGQPVGRSAARRHRRAAVGDDARRASRSRTRPASPTSTPTSASPSSAASSPTSSRRCRTTATTSTTEHPAPLGMTSTTLEPSTVPADRLAHGYRWEDEQWKDEPLLAERLVRLDGRHADVAVAISAATSARSSSAWPPRDGAGDGADQAIVAARDAAALAPGAARR